MNDTSITTATLDQTDEEILTTTVSDEALEAAAGTEGTFLPFSLQTRVGPALTCGYC